MLPYSACEAFQNCRVFDLVEMMMLFPKGAQIIERAMLNLARMAGHPVDMIRGNRRDIPFAVFTEPESVNHMLNDLQEIGYISVEPGRSAESGIRIKPKGWEQVERWRQKNALVVSKQAFVAMWFAPDMAPFYESGIVPAIKGAGYEPRRIDRVEHNNKIDDEIVAEIRKSRFVVADFTAGCCAKCETCDECGKCGDRVKVRGGVYFEAGYAMGLGIPVILTVRKDQIGQVHFDTRQYNHIVYETPDELRSRLYNRIAATIQ